MAQDVFRSVGKSSKSYRYVEAQYLIDSGVDNPYIASAYYSISDNVALRFSYFRYAGVVPVEGQLVNAALERTLVGAVYYKPFVYLSETDWIAGLDIGREVISARLGAARASLSDTAIQGYLGLRKSVGPKLEVQGGVNVVNANGDTNDSIDVVAVYRIGEFLDAAVGVLGVGDIDQVGIGLRYTF